MMSGSDHAAAAISVARRLLAGVAREDASSHGPIPVGAAVHTGVAFVGTVGSSEEISDFTALGRGELLVSVAGGQLSVDVSAVREAPLEVYSIPPARVAA